MSMQAMRVRFSEGFSPVGQEGLFWIKITSECHSCSVACKKLLAAEHQKTEHVIFEITG